MKTFKGKITNLNPEEIEELVTGRNRIPCVYGFLKLRSGNGHKITDDSIAKDFKVMLLKDDNENSYKFLGWSRLEKYVPMFENDAEIKEDSNITLYGQYETSSGETLSAKFSLSEIKFIKD